MKTKDDIVLIKDTRKGSLRSPLIARSGTTPLLGPEWEYVKANRSFFQL